MNIDQAKRLSLPDLLAGLGHRPIKETKGGYELWYRSPFREENAPSFHTTYKSNQWIWNDFADTGGTIIDFAIRYLQHLGKPSDVRSALTFIQDQLQPGLFSQKPRKPQTGTPSFSFHPHTSREAGEIFLEDRQLEFLGASPIHSRTIVHYLTQERHIPLSLLGEYLKEVRYRNLANGKEYFAFGMKNQAGGYEIRVATDSYKFKSALIARDITIVPGSDHSSVNVFEGMTDFLSLLAMSDQHTLSGDAIIMHSLSSYARTAEAIKAADYAIIKTYLDNNKPGQEYTERFKTEFAQRVFPQSEIFAPHIDLNDALRAYHSAKNTLPSRR